MSTIDDTIVPPVEPTEGEAMPVEETPAEEESTEAAPTEEAPQA